MWDCDARLLAYQSDLQECSELADEDILLCLAFSNDWSSLVLSSWTPFPLLLSARWGELSTGSSLNLPLLLSGASVDTNDKEWWLLWCWLCSSVLPGPSNSLTKLHFWSRKAVVVLGRAGYHSSDTLLMSLDETLRLRFSPRDDRLCLLFFFLWLPAPWGGVVGGSHSRGSYSTETM